MTQYGSALCDSIDAIMSEIEAEVYAKYVPLMKKTTEDIKSPEALAYTQGRGKGALLELSNIDNVLEPIRDNGPSMDLSNVVVAALGMAAYSDYLSNLVESFDVSERAGKLVGGSGIWHYGARLLADYLEGEHGVSPLHIRK